MKNRLFLFLFFIAVMSISCNNSSSSNTSDETIVQDEPVSLDTIAEVEKDTTPEKNQGETPTKNVDDWTVDDFIIKKPEGPMTDGVNMVMNQTIEYWKGAENPLTLTYKGAEMHDYYYLNFEDENKKNYDFGTGDNDFGDYPIVDEYDETNKEYLGKTFKVTWDWKKSSFPCCDGMGNNIEAYQPSIVKLELIETK